MDTLMKPNLPTCDIVYGKLQQIGFYWVWRRRGGESAVMKQADRLYHVTSPVGACPPNKTLHRNTPTISRYSAKLSKEKRLYVWLHVNGAWTRYQQRWEVWRSLPTSFIAPDMSLSTHGSARCGAFTSKGNQDVAPWRRHPFSSFNIVLNK